MGPSQRTTMSPAQAHAALAYFANRDEIDAELVAEG
jgi:hypothetical protein